MYIYSHPSKQRYFDEAILKSRAIYENVTRPEINAKLEYSYYLFWDLNITQRLKK